MNTAGSILHRAGLMASIILCLPGKSLAGPATVSTTTFTSAGPLTAEPSHTAVSNYGINPAVILTGNADNSFDIAYHLPGTSRIAIKVFNSAGVSSTELQPTGLTGATSLLGFARIPSDNSFAVAWSKTNANGAAWEYWVSRFNSAGTQIFATRIFGDQPQAQVNSKGEPGYFSSARMAYHPGAQNLILYAGHSQRWPDNIRHQGGFVATMSLTGTFQVLNGWYSSHNFDQRLLVDGDNFYTLAHGDAFPRALQFASWGATAAAGPSDSDNYLSIPGDVGDNVTNTQTGGFVKLPNGNFGVVYATKVGRTNFDVCYAQLSPDGVTVGSTFLTSHNASNAAIFPRIARYGDGAAVWWEQFSGGATVGVKARTISSTGIDPTTETVTDATVRLSPYHDPVTLPNGDVLWAAVKNANTLAIHRVAAASTAVTARIQNAVIQRSGAGGFPSIAGTVVNGPAGATVELQASTDFGKNDEWQTLTTITLNAAGTATFGPVSDPAAVGSATDFFRLEVP